MLLLSTMTRGARQNDIRNHCIAGAGCYTTGTIWWQWKHPLWKRCQQWLYSCTCPAGHYRSNNDAFLKNVEQKFQRYQNQNLTLGDLDSLKHLKQVQKSDWLLTQCNRAGKFLCASTSPLSNIQGFEIDLSSFDFNCWRVGALETCCILEFILW